MVSYKRRHPLRLFVLSGDSDLRRSAFGYHRSLGDAWGVMLSRQLREPLAVLATSVLPEPLLPVGFRTLRLMLSAIAVPLALMCGFARASCGTGGAAQVMVIPSVHKLLASNPHYSYAQLYGIVAAFHPDAVGVEIRQEDLARSADYLRHNYPREMVDLLGAYRDRIFGFDWLGDELTGIPVPDDWWTKRSRVKQLERAWAASTVPQDERTKHFAQELETQSDRRDAIAQDASPAMLAGGTYDRITADYYAALVKLTQGTQYALLPQWYALRDQHIAAAIAGEIVRHPGCRIVVVTGADHHGPVVRAVVALAGKATLVAVP